MRRASTSYGLLSAEVMRRRDTLRVRAFQIRDGLGAIGAPELLMVSFLRHLSRFLLHSTPLPLPPHRRATEPKNVFFMLLWQPPPQPRLDLRLPALSPPFSQGVRTVVPPSPNGHGGAPPSREQVYLSRPPPAAPTAGAFAPSLPPNPNRIRRNRDDSSQSDDRDNDDDGTAPGPPQNEDTETSFYGAQPNRRAKRKARPSSAHPIPRDAPSPASLRARQACVAALLPFVLLTSSHTSAHRAACIHLVLTPLTAPPLQYFARSGGCIPDRLCRIALCLGNAAALLLLLASAALVNAAAQAVSSPSPVLAPASSLPLLSTQNNNSAGGGAIIAAASLTQSQLAHYLVLVAHALLAITLCIGCVQLLLMAHKGNVIKVMACTAAAVMVAALALAASVSPPPTARRFLQTAALPFLLLFVEATRRPASSAVAAWSSSSSTPRAPHPSRGIRSAETGVGDAPPLSSI
jgi:hypothetical protein